MPAAVPHTSTYGLTNATFPYLFKIADRGLASACEASRAIAEGINTYQGEVVYPAVAQSQGRTWKDVATLF
jgi:alanine dehydrogenase